MTVSTGFIEDIMMLSCTALDVLAKDALVGRYVQANLPIPQPFMGKGEIKLVIIGQDPTVQNEETRQHIPTVLSLDRPGPLKAFLENLCNRLGLVLGENVYATNACKNFFTQPPTMIEELDVLDASARLWLPILQDELTRFPKATVITLGEPVLSMLVREGFSREVKHYWGYHKRWKTGKSEPMRSVQAEESTVDREIYPFIHQPSLRGKRTEFYRVRMGEYLGFVRQRGLLCPTDRT